MWLVGATPTLQASPFTTSGTSDVHVASQWRVFQGPDLIHDSGSVSATLTAYPLPSQILQVATEYSWQVRYQGQTLGWSPYSQPTQFTTANSFDQQKIDMAGGTGGTSGQTVYTAPNGVVVTSSAPVYRNSNYYYMQYLFEGNIPDFIPFLLVD